MTAEAQAWRTATGAPRGPRILVADGSGVTRASLTSTLLEVEPRAGIVQVSSGEEAAAALVEHRPDLAFVNVKFSGMSGPEAVAIARIQGANPITFLMSDAVIARWVDLAVEVDAYEFLKKPFDPDHIMAMLRSVRKMRTPLRLLLVDDSATARALVRRVLTNSRFNLEIEETDSGRHALKLLQLAHYDLALIDFNMAGIDGLETACQAREIAPDTRLLMMSASDNGNLAAATKHFGVSGFLKKPFYATDVEALLHRIYDLRRPYLMNALSRRGPPTKLRPTG